MAISRRQFLKTSALISGAVAVPTIVPATVFGENAPSNRITTGFIGTGGMGRQNMRGFRDVPSNQIVAVCDVDQRHLAKALALAGLEPKDGTGDFRELLARDDVDAVVIATPDHWHVPIAIAAARAGKDIYCEKPLSLTVAEGRRLADEVRRFGRILQMGSFQRSTHEFRFGCELVRNGRIGEMQRVEIELPGNNRTCPPTWQPQPVPEEFDYDMWLGPARWQPYTEQRCHYQFRFIHDYSGGQMTNWGAHYLDILQWGLGADNSGPLEISGRGKYPETGLFNTAITHNIEYIYANNVRVSCKTGGQFIKFIGSEGWVYITRGFIDAEPKSLLKSVIRPEEIHLYKSSDHRQNFFDCIRSRRDPITDAEIGHRSATVCHLGNMAMLLRRPIRWNPATEQVIDDPEANRMLANSLRSPWGY